MWKNQLTVDRGGNFYLREKLYSWLILRVLLIIFAYFSSCSILADIISMK